MYYGNTVKFHSVSIAHRIALSISPSLVDLYYIFYYNTPIVIQADWYSFPPEATRQLNCLSGRNYFLFKQPSWIVSSSITSTLLYFKKYKHHELTF